MLITIHFTSLPLLGSDIADEQTIQKMPEQTPKSKLHVYIYIIFTSMHIIYKLISEVCIACVQTSSIAIFNFIEIMYHHYLQCLKYNSLQYLAQQIIVCFVEPENIATRRNLGRMYMYIYPSYLDQTMYMPQVSFACSARSD